MAKTYEEFKAAFQKKGDIAPIGTQQSIYKKVLEDQKKKEAEAAKESGILKGSGLYHDNMQWWEHITAPIGTVAGTVGDVGLGVVQGAANLVEGVVDLGMHGVGAVGGLFGAKDFAQSVKDIANQRSVDTMFGNIEDTVGIENASVFGNQTDSVVQGVGQVAGLILTGGVGNAAGLSQGAVSALTMGVTGASSMGSGISEAYEGGATDAEAWAYGAIKGGVDTVTEMFFGGLGKTIKAIGLSKGITNIDDVVARKLSSKFSKQLAKNLVELGVKATAEGLEEFFAGAGTAVAKKLTYMSEEDIWKLIEDEKLLEQFISGMVVSAIAQSPTLVSSTKGKRSLASGTTKNEDSVIDKEYESRLAEAEKNGKKLSAWDKNKLYEKTIADMDKGRISIDTIEKTLGGEDYKAYQKYVNAENRLIKRSKSLKSEFDKLKNGERTGEQTDRLEKLRDLMKHNAKQINKIRNDPNRAKIKETLSNNVKELSKGSRLEASYVERENAKVHFSTGKAKLSDYSDAKRKTYEDVVKKKLLNNQNKTHDAVDFAANAADKLGIPIYFRTTEQLRLMGHKVDSGKRLNGIFTKKGIYINIESSKPLNFIVGHEITHALEGTDYYSKKLQSAVFDFAKSKNIFDERLKQVKEAYKGRSDADINAELTADLVGDLLFSDSDFINHIVSADRNMAQRLYDSIKHLLKLATSGSREERELEKAKWAFEQAFQEQSKNAKNAKAGAKKSEAKYSIDDLAEKQVTISKNINGKKYDVVDGIAVSEEVSKVMQSEEYKKPSDYMEKYSISTEPDWEKNYLANHHSEKDLEVVEAIRSFTDKMVQDDAVRGYVPNGDYKYSGMGPLRSNVEYIVTFDMDTSCPRTFQFLNFRDSIQRKAGRYLTYNESINLLELMRAYGQQIPCCYCYVENKRVLLSGSYNNFFAYRDAVLNAKTDADAEKAMYGYSDKKGLPDASRKALERWRSNPNYNPSVTDVWNATNTARNSVLNYLDAQMEAGVIDANTAQAKLNRMVRSNFGVTDKAAGAEIRGFVKDWSYDKLAGIPHIYSTENNTDVSMVDERALALNHEALAYAKSASSAKSVENYVPYTDQLKKISEKDRAYIIGMGGIRKHSSNDFRMDYVQDYFLFYADLAANKWTGHTYTKSADFAKIFACTKDRINMSVAFYEDADGTIRENTDEGASWKDVREIRKAYENVGSMAMVTSDNQLSYALNADWIDMIIPFHASGLDKSVWYNLRMWNDYTTKQSERFYNADTMRQKLNDAGVAVPKGANASEVKSLFEDTFSIKHVYGKNGEILKPHFFPGDTYVNGQLVPGHYNDVGTYFRLCEEYGVHPRFYGITVTDTNGQQIDVTEHPSYIKLIKETARTDSLQEEIEFNFGNYDEFLKMTPFEYAMQRLQEEANNGGFENTKADPYGVVEEFNKEYLGKDRPLGYLTDRAKKTRDILLEMSKESAAKQASVVEKASISNANETPQEYGDYAVYGKDVRVRDKDTEDIAPIGFTPSSVEAMPNDQEDEIEGIASTDAQNDSADGEDIAHVNVGDKEIVNQKGSALNKARTHLLDQHSVIEDLALETGNRELDAKANFIRTSEQRAQRLIGNGAEGVRALTDIRNEVKKSGLTQEFYDYMHHMHNIDRMSLADKGLGANKAVFGDNVTADVSRAKVAEFESKHPQFKRWAREVYDFNNYLRKLLVEGGVISQETADLWAQIYPHYVPIRREGKKGNAVNVPLDSGRTGINAPIKAAKGGNSKIEDMFQTMAMRAEQTYRAIAKNRFGIELKNTLQSASESGDVTLNEMIDVIGNDDGLVKKGENGSLPTFTVFENGKRVTFEITEDLYEALKPSSDLLSGTSKILNEASKLQRRLLTEYNLAFLVSNAIKDSQDVLMNSQHARKTYAEYGTAVSELFSHTRGKDGKWIKEYLDNGGEGLTHFNPKTKTFEDSDASMFKKAVGYVPQKISQANNFIERIPRLAEYIASRKMGKSIEGAMLDAARVTTNFAAGGDVTRFANRNGFTFLNASVQGFNQFVRNFREAKRKGLKGGLTLAAKAVAAGLPLVLVNHLLWGYDDEYEELSDYVKDNYYIVGKYGDGNFVRIPKGRTLAVIQNAFEQMKDQITGDDEIDLARFGELVANNIAPVNPLDNNVIAPIMQAQSNKTWYGDDLVPQRLQGLPNAEQYDETTDELSKWLGEIFNQSPYRINYLLDQYSGFVGDIALPMMTPKAEAGDSSLLGKIIAPIRDKFTTDSTLKNQNVTDFYDTVDELKKSANSMYSKDEDVLKYKYMSSINSEISDLYKKKRELQNSKLSDAEKYEEVRKVQREIDDIAKKALESYNNVSVNGIHAKVGDQQYKWNDSEKDPGWKKLDEKQVARQNLFTSALGIDENQYWEYSTGLSDIKSDEDAYGDTISGSRKKKVLKYIGGLDIDLGAKLILYKNEYNGDDNYNEYIVSYLNSKDNLTYSDRLDILKQIGFEVSADGSKVYW